jgi:hypothetical protein
MAALLSVVVNQREDGKLKLKLDITGCHVLRITCVSSSKKGNLASSTFLLLSSRQLILGRATNLYGDAS